MAVALLAPLPELVSDAQAATLPVAGLTALHALRQGGLLLGRKVLTRIMHGARKMDEKPIYSMHWVVRYGRC